MIPLLCQPHHDYLIRLVYVEEIKQQGRQEGELKGRLETIEGLLRAGIGWPVIRSATGIDEQTYRAFKRDSANGAEQAAPR